MNKKRDDVEIVANLNCHYTNTYEGGDVQQDQQINDQSYNEFNQIDLTT